MEPEGLLSCSEELGIGSCPEPDVSSPHSHIYFFKIQFNVFLPCTSICKSSKYIYTEYQNHGILVIYNETYENVLCTK